MMADMPPSRRALRVLHTADVHLDGDGHVFRRIVDRAIADAVDLVLIAGDLFDNARVPDETVAFVRSELGRAGRPVVILPGNHDALHASSVYDRGDFTAGLRDVHVIRRLDGETVELPALDAQVWGRGMEEHEPAFRPLAGIPSRDDGRWCLAMGHGFFYPERQTPERSSPIFADEIRDAGCDYLALGHQHVQTDVSQGAVTAWYAGAPGRVLRIDLTTDHGIRVEPRPLA